MRARTRDSVAMRTHGPPHSPHMQVPAGGRIVYYPDVDTALRCAGRGQSFAQPLAVYPPSPTEFGKAVLIHDGQKQKEVSLPTRLPVRQMVEAAPPRVSCDANAAQCRVRVHPRPGPQQPLAAGGPHPRQVCGA